MKNPSTTRLASVLIVGQNPINDEDIDGGLHPAVDGQSQGEGEGEGEEVRIKALVRLLFI